MYKNYAQFFLLVYFRLLFVFLFNIVKQLIYKLLKIKLFLEFLKNVYNYKISIYFLCILIIIIIIYLFLIKIFSVIFLFIL